MIFECHYFIRHRLSFLVEGVWRYWQKNFDFFDNYLALSAFFNIINNLVYPKYQLYAAALKERIQIFLWFSFLEWRQKSTQIIMKNEKKKIVFSDFSSHR